jgi:single-strand DNA-binding protein
MDLNRTQLIWRITQDLELKSTPSGQNVVSFSVVTNRNWTDQSWAKQEQAEFHNVVLWWKLAEIASQYLWKGRKIFIEWRLQTRSWEAQDWTKRYKTEIVWENMIMLDWKDSNSDLSNNTQFAQNSNQFAATKKVESKIEEEISIEDIPF